MVLPEGLPVHVEEKREQQRPDRAVVFVETKEKAPREFCISRKDGEKLGTLVGVVGVLVALEVRKDKYVLQTAKIVTRS